jgi:pyruvoyl-dependent arginine decarboxylase (PvlArgDC)
MQRHRVSGEQAFQILIKASQDSNIKLHEVAGFLVEHAESAAREHAESTAREHAESAAREPAESTARDRTSR